MVFVTAFAVQAVKFLGILISVPLIAGNATTSFFIDPVLKQLQDENPRVGWLPCSMCAPAGS